MIVAGIRQLSAPAVLACARPLTMPLKASAVLPRAERLQFQIQESLLYFPYAEDHVSHFPEIAFLPPLNKSPVDHFVLFLKACAIVWASVGEIPFRRTGKGERLKETRTQRARLQRQRRMNTSSQIEGERERQGERATKRKSE